MSAISRIGDSCSQNARDLARYYAALDGGCLPVARGIALSENDLIRREAINQLMCHGWRDKMAFGERHRLLFDVYFAEVLERLAAMERDGLVCMDQHQIRVTPRGRMLSRIIAACFDACLGGAQPAQRYSRTI